MALEPVIHDIVVDLSRGRAFELFADRIGQWWPIAYTFSGPQFGLAGIDPRPGGRWFERTQRGEQLSWGRVRGYERGARLVLGFGVGGHRGPIEDDQASEVEIRFTDAGSHRTRVTVEHRAFERHGASAEQLHDGMASPQGWPTILAEYAREAQRDPRH
jgi:uncharacterized protein YndB with AHSA1/START domain